MKIKTKLILGIGLLFIMIALLTVLSTIFITKLSADTKNILAENYKTLDYSREMLVALNNDIALPANAETFKQNLLGQLQNITEPGEQSATEKLQDHFYQLLSSPRDSSLQHITTSDITAIMTLNMKAIQRKSNIAATTAKISLLWMTIAGVICFLIAFTLLINLPGNIANPIRELTASIREIAAENYTQRVHFIAHNEFGELSSAFNTMAEKLEEYKAGNIEKLIIEKVRNETLINNMTDPVIGLDEKFRVIFMNNVALKIAGLSSEGVIGVPVQDIAVRNDLMRSLVQDLFTEAGPNKTGKDLPVKIYADGKESYFEKEIIPIQIIPTGEKTEKLIGIVIMLQNITPYKELDFAKTNFIATVSHELKTPISSIKMSIQLLENNQTGNLNSEQQSLIEGIKDDAMRLLKITGELLNMTQVESGTIQLVIQPAAAPEILQNAINANKISADEKKIVLRTVVPDSLPNVLADMEKTTWVLNNLISNAIRYSYENSEIEIKITAKNNFLRFIVSDTGQGIAPVYLAKIFDRYFRIPGTKKEGTGLGLSISKEFIEAQQGTLNVSSDFGAGSVFTISLPAAPLAV